MLFVLNLRQLLEELLQADPWVDDHWPHLGQALQVRVKVDRVEDAERLLPDLRALAGRAAQHLLVQDATVDPAEEHEVGDAGQVDARGEEIDRDGDLRQGVVAVGADQLADLIDAAGDLAQALSSIPP
jgi:hypothetical protein